MAALVVCTAACVKVPVAPSVPPAGPVQKLPDMRVPHHSAGVVAYEDRLYVWSGYTSPGQSNYDRTDVLEVYDPSARAWKQGAPLPGLRSGMGCLVLNGKFYSIGGETNPSGSFTDTVYRYDPKQDKWDERKGLPSTAWNPMCVACSGKAYVIGGRQGYGPTYPQVLAYDEEKESWQQMAEMPQSVMLGAIVASAGKIYVFGGTHFESESQRQPLQVMQIYDTAKDSWTTQSMPWKLSRPQAILHGQDIWLFAHDILDEADKPTPCPWAFKYSPASGKWTRYSFLLPEDATLNSPLAVIQDKVYFTDFYKNEVRLTKAACVDLKSLEGAVVQGVMP